MPQNARLFFLHVGLLTTGSAIIALLYNLALVAFGLATTTLILPLLGPVPLLGALTSLPVLSATLSSVPLWLLVTRWGERASLLLATLLQVLALLPLLLRPEPGFLLAGAALSGPASVLFQVSVAPLLMRQSNAKNRDHLFSLNAALVIGVSGMATLIGGFMPNWLAQWFGLPLGSPASYQATFTGATLLIAIAIVPLLLMREVGVQNAARKSTRSTTAILPVAVRELLPLLRFVISPLVISCGAALFIPYLNLYFAQRFNASDATVGIVLALISIATGAATLLAPRLAARMGKMPAVVLTQALAVPCLILLGSAPALGTALLFAVLRGTLMNMAAPLYDAYTMEQTPPALRPTLAGLVNGAFNVGYIVGPTFSVIIQQRYGFGPIFFLTAICYSFATAINYFLFVRRQGSAL
ncbi:MFS transporter [Candidatus Gracilibacteria bacterium]|nr:MFS transporter [Candidatus Gracilibacteria bacterium]